MKALMTISDDMVLQMRVSHHVPVLLRLVSSATSLSRPHPAFFTDTQVGGEFNGLNRAEAIERVQLEEDYRDTVIKAQLQQDADEANANEAPAPGAGEKNYGDDPHLGDLSEEDVICVLLARDPSPPYLVPVQPLVSLCRTVQRMVASRLRYGVHRVGDSSGGANCDETICTDAASAPSKVTGSNQDSCPIMELSLVEFAADAVVQFIGVLISLYDRQRKEALSKDPKTSKKRRINEDGEESTICAAIDGRTLCEEHIVECLKLAHFLQCPALEQPLASIVELSIDSRNCMAICSLADTLNLNSLFEASVNHVIEKLDDIQGTGGSSTDNKCHEGGEVAGTRASERKRHEANGDTWASLPHELRSRVLTMRNVMRSSVIGRGSRASGLFFSGASEFLAIFREVISDQKERLDEARARREEVVRERQKEWRTGRRPRGGRHASAAAAEREFVYGGDVAYAAGKIEKQSQRLETLESFYEEQRVIFREGGFESPIKL